MRTAAAGSNDKTKGKNMKNKITIALTALALGASAFAASAQDHGAGSNGDSPHGREMRGHRPPPPLMLALDANHDGVIDADEIANASAALKKLDENGDGKLTQDELRPPRPMRPNHPANDGANRPDDAPPGTPPDQQ